MEWQMIIVWTLVGVASLYLARAAWKSMKPCSSGGCGCRSKKVNVESKETFIQVEELQVRKQP